eukprot:1154054-Pelagomonas_calceolata.AAC.3
MVPGGWYITACMMVPEGWCTTACMMVLGRWCTMACMMVPGSWPTISIFRLCYKEFTEVIVLASLSSRAYPSDPDIFKTGGASLYKTKFF